MRRETDNGEERKEEQRRGRKGKDKVVYFSLQVISSFLLTP